MTKRILSLFILALAQWSMINDQWSMVYAQDFDPKQGYRLEIGDGLALDNLSGTITFSPVNKKSQTQVWRIQKSDKPGYWCFYSPSGDVALDNGNHGSQEGEVLTWSLDTRNANQQWLVKKTGTETYVLTCAAGGLKLGYNDTCQPGGHVWQLRGTNQSEYL